MGGSGVSIRSLLAGLLLALLSLQTALALEFDWPLPPQEAVARYPWLGPAVSRPFPYGGGRVQIFRYGALFWTGAEVSLLNTFDEVARLGGDELLAQRGVPRHRPVRDWTEALALLERVPAIRERVLRTPDWLERYGLPIAVDTSRPDFAVVRFQRAVLQEWKVAVPWAQPGEVTQVPLEQLLPGTPLAPQTAWPPAGEPDWLRRLNEYRVAAGLLPVTEDPVASGRAAAHSRYIIMTQQLTHEEDRRSPFFSEGGDWAGRRGNILWTAGPNLAGAEAVDVWWHSPPHAMAMLFPILGRVGYGTFAADPAPGPYRFAATLEVYTESNWVSREASQGTLPVLLPFRGRTLYQCPTRCAESGHLAALWVEVWHRPDQTVEGARIWREGQEIPVFLWPGGWPETPLVTVASCLTTPQMGRYHAAVVVGGRTFTLDWTVIR